MEGTSLVHRVTLNLCQKSTSTSTETGFFKASDLDHLRGRFHAELILKRAATLITSSRHNSLLNHYEPAWGKCVSLYSKRKVCPNRCDVDYVLAFLAELFESCLQYRTIGSHRSALSTFYDPIGSINVGNCPRVLALMRGGFLTKDLHN